MSTPGCIARKTKDGFEGRYHNFDSYPEGLGKALYGVRNGYFKKNTEAMLKYLIDDHPAGWSSIVQRDFNKKAGFDGDGPLCYCHGTRNEDEQLITEEDAESYLYVYAFEDNIMHIMGVVKGKWKSVKKIDMDKKEPNWNKIKVNV